MFQNYPDILVKKTESDFTLNDTPISADRFLIGMGRCGFDMTITWGTLCCLTIGGKWMLNLTDKQKKTIFSTPDRSPIGFG